MAKKATITKNKYNKTHTKQFLLVYHNVYDADIIETLLSVPNRNDFIRQLVRDYNTRTGSAPKAEKKEGITMKRTYGSTRTHLTLEGKALEFYNMTDPIRIEETEEDGEFTYQVFSGNEPMHDGVMTEEKLIKWLEDGYDEYMNV